MVMAVLLTNNARSTLLNGINALQTEIRLRAGGGNTFPTITATGQWFPITIEDSLGNIEIMRVIARSGDVFTVKRAQEGTTAKSFSANDVVELRLTVGAMQELVGDTHTNFGRIYMTPADGVDPKIGVPAGYYFNVRSPSDDSYVDEYQNVNGVAVATGKIYPSGALTQAMSEQIDKIGSLDYLSEQLDQIAVDKGWDASFVVDGSENQHQINSKTARIAKTIKDLIAIQSPKDGQTANVLGYHSATNFALSKPYRGGGQFVFNASLEKSKHNGGTIIDPNRPFPTDWSNQDQVQTWFTPNLTGSGAWVRVSNDEYAIKVDEFGAKGDGVADDTVAINLAIAYASQTPVSSRVSSVVYFPAGIYRITSTLTVTANGVELRGEYESGTNMNESEIGYGSTHIYYDAENGLPAIKFGKSSGLQFGNGLRGIRLSANSSLVNKPIGLQLAGLSESYLRDFHINVGFAVGLDSISSALVWLYNFDIGNCDINMRISSDIAAHGIQANQIWINSGNFWNARYDHIKITARTALYISESWMEFAQRFFNIEQITDARVRVDILINNSEGSVALAYSPNDPTYNMANNRIIKARALDGAAEPLVVCFATSDNSIFYTENADYAFEYIRGTNQNIESRFAEATLSDSKIYGVNIAGVHSDTHMSSVSAIGNIECRASLFNEIRRPITSDSCKLNALISEYGHWDMSAGHPLRLPSKPPTNTALDGQVYFNNTHKRVQYTYNGATFSVPRPHVLVLGDQNFTYDNVTSSETIIFNAPLSGIRSIGFDTNNVFNGQKARVCRTAASSGASYLGVIANGLVVKQLNSGQWCDLEFGPGGWYVTASGNL